VARNVTPIKAAGSNPGGKAKEKCSIKVITMRGVAGLGVTAGR
jgi:hypothetical protein